MMFIHELFQAQVDETPDSIALTFEGDSLTYRGLDDSEQVVAALGILKKLPRC